MIRIDKTIISLEKMMISIDGKISFENMMISIEGKISFENMMISIGDDDQQGEARSNECWWL